MFSFKALNNGHRRASSPQSSLAATNQLATNNQSRTGTAAGTGCRGRPPKVRKDLTTQSSVRFMFSMEVYSILLLFQQY